MENKLRIALIQTELLWEDPQANRTMLQSKIKGLANAVDLIVLPEMFSTGFTMDAISNFETMQGETLNWLKQMARQLNSAICGSLIIKEAGVYYNRFVFVQPDTTVTHYDKRHTFTLAGEDKAFSSGTHKVVLQYKGWTICPLVCYDLRFPVWSRNTEDCDLLIYVANWPNKRILAWDTLLRARAIENMTYTIGVNRFGVDGKNIEYSGHSAVYDALGQTIIFSEKEEVLTTTLDRFEVLQQRNKFKFLEDRDQFTVR
ncbi:amidohydrolase [Galbibacter sp.]|jgi:predicted amidohydrolase|uniref:amidohydrolase n=1 Tax=Galbibacter sp. TaxID=2918471 RepID=UPI003A92B02A